MKIIEGMKKLRVIEKRMEKNMESISKYSSLLNTERPYFETEDRQRQEVKSLLQANKNLMEEYLTLKKNLEYTNLNVVLELGGKEYSISELLVLKRKMARTMIDTYGSLNAKSANLRLSSSRMRGEEKTPQAVRLYKEEDKNAGLAQWQDIYDNIDSRLEVLNATEDLKEIK
jgi:hypothetical protein